MAIVGQVLPRSQVAAIAPTTPCRRRNSRLVGALELAFALAAHDDVFAEAQKNDVLDPVAVDVDGVGAEQIVDLKPEVIALKTIGPPFLLSL